MTTEHLPECSYTSGIWYSLDEPCICHQLRACEERVREEESRNVIGSVSLAAIGEANLQQYQLGFSEGLDAAREAVMASGGHHERCICDECYGTAAAVAAIDALRNPPSLPPTTGRALKY